MSERKGKETIVFPNADCYLSVRIANCKKAFQVENQLRSEGLIVNNPCRIDLVDTQPEDMPIQVSSTCYQMMDNSATTVVVYSESEQDGKRVGRDCAAEMGYTIGSDKPVLILVDEGTLDSARQRLVHDFPIHHHDISENYIADGVEGLVELLRGIKSEQ